MLPKLSPELWCDGDGDGEIGQAYLEYNTVF